MQRLLPQACVLCGGESGTDTLCAPCRTELPRLPAEGCKICALPLTHGRVCGVCIAKPPDYDAVTAALVYAFPVDAVIQRLKYRGDLSMVALLGDALAQRVAGPVDVIVPMPLSAARLRSRGFNQAMEIARVVQATTGLPLAAHACRRSIDTLPQATLPWEARAKNVRGAFECMEDFSGLHVAVVDDVMTTGATLAELARTLKHAGAARVSGWIAARTLRGEATAAGAGAGQRTPAVPD